MKYYPVNNLRNVCLLGQGGCGKTSLAEAMLFLSKATDRLGKIADGNTISDFDAEEIKRKISISTSLLPIEWKDCKINLLDTPGYFDFEGEVIEAVSVADTALIVLSGKSGIGVGTEKAFKLASDKKLPAAFIITKLDDENADYFKVHDSLKEKFGSHICAVEIPIVENGKLLGVLNVVDMKASAIDAAGNKKEIQIPASLAAKADEFRAHLNEAIAEEAEDLMEKYFAGEEFTAEDTKRGIALGIISGELIPVFCGSSTELSGINAALDFITEYFPSPIDVKPVMAETTKGEIVELKVDENAPTAALVFKTIADPFVGKMSYFKVISGSVKADGTLTNSRTGHPEKIGHIFFIRGKKQVEAQKIGAGDIAVITKLSDTITGDTLCDAAKQVVIKGPEFPKPCLSMAVLPKAKGDEEKISTGMHKLAEEDLTFTFVNNVETKQHVISGMGEMHLDVLVSKLKNKFGTSVDLIEPDIAFREAIKKKVKVEGKHKKQSGGHGQFGHVWIEFEPTSEQELVFEEKVFGGAVPRNFFPAVEKGLRDSVLHGVLAGYPVVNLKATLVDGSYHPVDSSEMAFKIAASAAYKIGLAQAMPILLEPIGNLKVYIPDAMMGDIIGDINKRRGHILGMNPSEDGIQIVEATVPMAEVHRYAIDLRSMTQGRGYFTLEFSSYQEAPANIASKVIEESKHVFEEEK